MMICMRSSSGDMSLSVLKRRLASGSRRITIVVGSCCRVLVAITSGPRHCKRVGFGVTCIIIQINIVMTL